MADHDKEVVFVLVKGNHMYFDKANALASAKEEDIEAVYAKEKGEKKPLANANGDDKKPQADAKDIKAPADAKDENATDTKGADKPKK
jgi:hypothetical protein